MKRDNPTFRSIEARYDEPAVPLDPPGLFRGTDGAWAAEVGGFEPPARVEYEVRASQESDQSSASTTTTTLP